MPARARRRISPFAVVLIATVLSGPPLLSRAAGFAQSSQSFPPPTPVPPDGSPSPYPTALVTPPPSDRPPPLRAASAILVDLDDGRTLYAKAARTRRPVASLTKLMTALLVTERTEPEDPVTAGPDAEDVSTSELGLVEGETLPVSELLDALLMQSANDVAVALADHVGGTVDRFVEEMNERAGQLGLRDTRFASPNGLDDRGYSTAADLARLARTDLDVPELARIVRTKFHDVPAGEDEPRHIQNRNALLWLYPGAIGVKTGFTSAAGFCLIAAAERGDERYLAVVLGEPTHAWNDGAALLNYGFAAFDRREVIRAGDPVPPVRLRGLRIPAVAGDAASAYVPDGAFDLEVRVTAAPALDFPLQDGQTLGSAVVAVNGVEVGRIRVVAGDLPGPPGEGRPLWLRIGAVLAAILGTLLRRATLA